MCNMNDGMRSILQVTKSTDVPRQMLFVKGSSESVSKCLDVDRRRRRRRHWKRCFQEQIYSEVP